MSERAILTALRESQREVERAAARFARKRTVQGRLIRQAAADGVTREQVASVTGIPVAEVESIERGR